MSKGNPWTDRYAVLSNLDEIKRRIRVSVAPLAGLSDDAVELACRRLVNALAEVFVPTSNIATLIRNEIGRAHAHATIYYSDPATILARANSDSIKIEPYMPSCISGPAGTGKTRWRRALARALGEIGTVQLGDGHGIVPLVPFTSVLVGTQRSVSQILRALARPEIQSGKVRISEADLPGECALWQAIVGGCLFGVDELQFLTQSKDASTLVTVVLQALLDVKTPWFYIANYSLCWKLMQRPPESTQRLLGRPLVLLPESPGSEDWREILREYQRIAPEVFAFDLVTREIELWNYCAGLKRLLVQLIELTYRYCREHGRFRIGWADVERGYLSGSYKLNCSDVEKMIAYAIQGGDLKQDLKCPFEDDASADSIEKYKAQLRDARHRKVVAASVDASLNVEERNRIAAIKQRADGGVSAAPGKVVRLPRVAKRSVEGLLEAGRRFGAEKSAASPTSGSCPPVGAV